MTGFVYFIKAEDYLKIGFSTDPVRRFSKVASDTPLPCQLLGYIKGGADVEDDLHYRFREYQSHGEWFHLSSEIQEYVDGLALTNGTPGRRTKEKWNNGTAIGVYMAENNMNAVDLARKLSVSQPTLTRALNGERAPRDVFALEVERATNGEVTAEQFLADCFTLRRARNFSEATV